MDKQDYTIAMLSPPLSPYPRSTELMAGAGAGVGTVGGGSGKKLAALEDAKNISSNIKRSNDNEDVLVTPPQKKRQIDSIDHRLKVVEKHGKKREFSIAKYDPKTPLRSNAWTSLKKDPVAYFERERAYLEMYTLHGPSWSNYVSVDHGVPRYNSSSSANGTTSVSSYLQAKMARQARSATIGSRRRFAYHSDAESDTGAVTRSSIRNSSLAPEALVHRTTSSNVPSRPSTPVHRQYRSAASSPAPSKVHDMSLSQITDYSPSSDSLPPGKSLRAEWKGVPMDLSQDPSVHLLHPAEIHLASVLRLPVDIYLDSKRRLFAEKVHRLRQGLPFRRTDSQKACRIDVNKASRLFSAYEKVGWLDDKLFKKYL